MKNVKKGHKHPIVCLDAGHCGKYNRSPVVPEYYESDMNWKLHTMLKKELEAYGIEVKQTRTAQDKDLALVARGKASEGCDLFLSTHSNAAGSESVDRPVGIYLVDDKSTDIDELSKEVAVLLSEVVAKVMETKDKAQQYSKLDSTDRDGDGKKDDDYYGVLYGAHQVGTPGVILEHSFHTNTRAAKWLLVDSNLEKLAKAEAKAIAETYFGMAAPKKPASVKQYYRVRKSWADAASQLGAYSKLENAKRACPAGYTVYDWNGAAMYTNKPASKPASPTKKGKKGYAKSFDKAQAGTYVVKSSDGLNLRAGASTEYDVLETMANGSKFRCYGYYTDGWLYGKSASGVTGFCSKEYLVKK